MKLCFFLTTDGSSFNARKVYKFKSYGNRDGITISCRCVCRLIIGRIGRTDYVVWERLANEWNTYGIWKYIENTDDLWVAANLTRNRPPRIGRSRKIINHSSEPFKLLFFFFTYYSFSLLSESSAKSSAYITVLHSVSSHLAGPSRRERVSRISRNQFYRFCTPLWSSPRRVSIVSVFTIRKRQVIIFVRDKPRLFPKRNRTVSLVRHWKCSDTPRTGEMCTADWGGIRFV